MNRENLQKVLDLEEKIKGYEKILDNSCITSLISFRSAERYFKEDPIKEEMHEFDVHISVPITDDDLVAEIDNLHSYYLGEFQKIIERRIKKLERDMGVL